MTLNRIAALRPLVAGLAAATAHAQEAAIRKNLAERIPQLQKIDEVRKRRYARPVRDPGRHRRVLHATPRAIT